MISFIENIKPGAAGVHEKSELKKTWFGINYVSFDGSGMSSLIGFRGALFFCFFYFGRAKEKGWYNNTIIIYETDDT